MPLRAPIMFQHPLLLLLISILCPDDLDKHVTYSLIISVELSSFSISSLAGRAEYSLTRNAQAADHAIENKNTINSD